MMRYDNLMMSLTLRCLGITNRGFMAGIIQIQPSTGVVIENNITHMHSPVQSRISIIYTNEYRLFINTTI